MKIKDLTYHELYIVLDFYITRNYVKKDILPSDEIDMKIYQLIVVLDKIINKGLGWFRKSKWNEPIFYESISFFTSKEIVNKLLEFIDSDKDILKESKFEESFFDTVSELYDKAKKWIKANTDILDEKEEKLLQIFQSEVIQQTRVNNKNE